MTDAMLYLDDLKAKYLTSPLPLRAPGQPDLNANLRTSADGRALNEAFEGCDRPIKVRPGSFTTYFDEVGVLTIGYGHTNLGNVGRHIKQGDVWSRQECDEGLSVDLGSFEIDVRRYFPNLALKQYQLDALVSFDFNTGALGRSSLPAKINAGHIDAAMATLLQYNHAGGQVLAGLTRRRRAERLMFLGMVDDALVLAGAHRDTRMAMSKATTATGGEI